MEGRPPGRPQARGDRSLSESSLASRALRAPGQQVARATRNGITASAQAPADPPLSQSLPRARIIRRRAVFDAARNKGRRVSNRYMALNFLPREAVKPGEPAGETGTVAFLTPKRVGAATKRTQLRRRMREIYRRYLAHHDEKAYLVWVARPPALELPFEELKKCMTALRERMKS